MRVARELAKDAFLKVVLHDGMNIHTVVHFGRRRPAELNTALELGAPPDFDGVTCAEVGCDRRYGLEWDHVDPVANDGPTSAENLQPRCWPDHRDKTARDRAAGLLNGKASEAGKNAGLRDSRQADQSSSVDTRPNVVPWSSVQVTLKYGPMSRSSRSRLGVAAEIHEAREGRPQRGDLEEQAHRRGVIGAEGRVLVEHADVLDGVEVEAVGMRQRSSQPSTAP